MKVIVRTWGESPVWVNEMSSEPSRRRAARGKPPVRAWVVVVRSCGAESWPLGKRRRA